MLFAVATVIAAIVFALGPVVARTFDRGVCALDAPTPQTQC